MPKRKIEFVKNGVYHVFNRSTEKMTLFRSAADYHHFLSKMHQYSEHFKINLPAWSLLPTHYHLLLIQTGEETISKFIHRLCSSYGHYFNNKYNRTGRLFERKFKAKHIENDDYLHRVEQYIQTNAIHHKLVEEITDWPYSSIHSRQITTPTLELKMDSYEFEEMELLC